MQRWTSFSLRAAFIVGFLIVLPLMAMPSVAGFLDRLLYGNAASSIPPSTESETAPASRVKDQEASRTTQESPLSAASAPFAEVPASGVSGDFRSAPPPLPSAPDFLSRAERAGLNVPAADPADVGPLDQATAERIDSVRSRLEELGAEYVRLEMSEDGRTFDCLCEMLVKNSGGKTQPFEATRNDPVAAAEAVLANVEAWRNAETSPSRASKSGPKRLPR